MSYTNDKKKKPCFGIICSLHRLLNKEKISKRVPRTASYIICYPNIFSFFLRIQKSQSNYCVFDDCAVYKTISWNMNHTSPVLSYYIRTNNYLYMIKFSHRILQQKSIVMLSIVVPPNCGKYDVVRYDVTNMIWSAFFFLDWDPNFQILFGHLLPLKYCGRSVQIISGN